MAAQTKAFEELENAIKKQEEELEKSRVQDATNEIKGIRRAPAQTRRAPQPEERPTEKRPEKPSERRPEKRSPEKNPNDNIKKKETDDDEWS